MSSRRRSGRPLVNAGRRPAQPNQDYLDAAPTGIDARYAWTFAGGDGAGQRVVDMERGWTFNHEDLAAHGITLINGSTARYFARTAPRCWGR